MIESRLRDYLAGNLGIIDPDLRLVATEYVIPGGRLDILAENQRSRVAIELKAAPYDTRRVNVQLLLYLNYAPLVYFVAPKVRRGVYAALQQYYHRQRLKFFELTDGLQCTSIDPEMLDDSRPFPKIHIPESPWPLPLRVACTYLSRKGTSGVLISSIVKNVYRSRFLQS